MAALQGPVGTEPAPVRMGLFLSGWLDPSASAPSAIIRTLLDRVSVAEAAGFSSVWVGQHILAEPWPVLTPASTSACCCGDVHHGDRRGHLLPPGESRPTG